MFSSGDEFLAMRLIRDKIPGVGERYIQFPKEELVRALEKYSPLRQIGPDDGEPALTGELSTPPPAPEDSPASKRAEVEKKPTAEAEDFSGGDGGGPNSTRSKYLNLSSLLMEFLDQFARLGETAVKLRNFKDIA